MIVLILLGSLLPQILIGVAQLFMSLLFLYGMVLGLNAAFTGMIGGRIEDA